MVPYLHPPREVLKKGPAGALSEGQALGNRVEAGPKVCFEKGAHPFHLPLAKRPVVQRRLMKLPERTL